MEENLLIKKKKKSNITKITSLFLIIGLFVMVIGVSYAYFEYYQTGTYSYTINGGKMDVIYSEETGNTIKIDNLYPMSDLDAKEKAIEFEFSITGFNESEDNVYYAIEIDYGVDKENQNRFKDSDLKLSLYENEEVIFENEIFNNLDNQDVHYGYISKGTSENTPIVNSYKLRLWINDNVIITNTPDKINIDLTDKSVYTTSEFSNLYGSFKVNVKADLTYDDVGYITYDANGGINTPEKTSLTINRVTSKKPVMANKGFLGWSGTKDGEVEYKSGDIYDGKYDVLYAIYSNNRNVMNDLPTEITNKRGVITEIYFISDTQINIDARYDESSIKADLTYNSQGSVKGWLEEDYLDEETSTQYYKLYVGSEGATYLNTGKYLFSSSSLGEINKFGSLKSIDFTNADTSSVTNMSYMFYYCKELISLNISSFDTSKVTNMSSMFKSCKKLLELDVSNFDTSNVTSMSGMYGDLRNLSYLDLSYFDTSNVTDMSSMFSLSRGLVNVDLSSFDTSNVTDMSSMFQSCSGLIELNVNSFNTSQVTNMSYMFDECSSLNNLDVSFLDISNVTEMSFMFYRCRNLVTIYCNSKWNIETISSSRQMFYECPLLVGAVSYDSSKTDITMANPDTGYFTRKTV